MKKLLPLLIHGGDIEKIATVKKNKNYHIFVRPVRLFRDGTEIKGPWSPSQSLKIKK